MKIQARSDKNKNLSVNWNFVMQYIKKWVPGTLFEISVTRRSNENKGPLRKYYWSVVMPLFLEAYGYDPDEAETVHRHLKIIFFGVKADNYGVYREKDIPALFADESDKDNATKLRFIDWCKRKAAEAGVYIPDPNER
jgi:hypothetical protein